MKFNLSEEHKSNSQSETLTSVLDKIHSLNFSFSVCLSLCLFTAEQDHVPAGGQRGDAGDPPARTVCVSRYR